MKLSTGNNFLKTIGKIADEKRYKVFVVGGYVRDLILGKEDNDIDIMVLGDGIKFAETVAAHFQTGLDAVYKNFETALLKLDETKIEFASARKESYDRNSRKPVVETATLEEDLSRRDGLEGNRAGAPDPRVL